LVGARRTQQTLADDSRHSQLPPIDHLMSSFRQIGSHAATGVLVLCALTVTGFTLRRELRSSPAAVERQKDWLTYSETGHRLGPENGRVVIVEFSDFQCPACAMFEKRLADLRRRHPNDLKLIYRHFPLEKHPFAAEAAHASECASSQGRFEAMHDALFAGRDSLGERSWSNFASAAGVGDLLKFEACMADSSAVAPVRRDVEAGKRLGIRGTPTLLLDGHRINGVLPLDTLDAMIQRALRDASAK
jgi:protein-disulfide isomerase